MHNVESCVCEEKNKKSVQNMEKASKRRVSPLRAVQKKWTKFRSGFFVIIEL